MSAKSKKSSKTIDRPFDPKLLQQARDLVERYQIIIHREEGEYYGRGLELPNAMGDGKTADACLEETREALTTLVAYLLEKGETPPPPASDNKRTEQINIRLTVEEKLLLEERARSKGFRGVSDFVRSASLSAVRDV